MARLIKVLTNKKGVTLIEMIVSMIVLSLILVAITTVFAPMLITYDRANNLAEANTLLDNISQLILEDVANATRITPGPADPGNVTPGATLFIIRTVSDIDYYTNADGILCRRTIEYDSPLLSPDFYKSKRISAACSVNSGLVTITLTLYAADGWEMDRSYTARPVGLAG